MGRPASRFAPWSLVGAVLLSVALLSVGTPALALGVEPAPSPIPPVAAGGAAYAAVSPVRLLDTRTALGSPGAVPANSSVVLRVVGSVVPASAVAVALNVTVVAPRAPGHVSVAPSEARASSNLNFVQGQTVANLVISKVNDAGEVVVYNASSRPLHMLADLQGYFNAGGPGAVYQPLAPARVLDTRAGIGAARAAVPAGPRSPWRSIGQWSRPAPWPSP